MTKKKTKKKKKKFLFQIGRTNCESGVVQIGRTNCDSQVLFYDFTSLFLSLRTCVCLPMCQCVCVSFFLSEHTHVHMYELAIEHKPIVSSRIYPSCEAVCCGNASPSSQCVPMFLVWRSQRATTGTTEELPVWRDKHYYGESLV